MMKTRLMKYIHTYDINFSKLEVRSSTVVADDDDENKADEV